MITSKIIANGILRAIGYFNFSSIITLFSVSNSNYNLSFGFIDTDFNWFPILDFLKKRLKFKHTLATIAVLSDLHFNHIGFYNDVYSFDYFTRSKFISFKYN